MKHVIRLVDKHNPFYCPVNNVHLYYYNPVAEIEVVTADIQYALKVKRLVDVNKNITFKEDKEPMKEVETKSEALFDKEEEKPYVEASKDGELVELVPVVEVSHEGDEKPEEAKALFNTDNATRNQLLKYIKDEDITFKSLNIKGSSDTEKIRKALKDHLVKNSK